MPHATKLYWLAKDSISIEITRGTEPIKWKLSSVDEGIVVEIAKGEAHGVLNVSVATTRRPKVNDSFTVDFGKGFVDTTMDFGRLVAQDVVSYLTLLASQSTHCAEEIRDKTSVALGAAGEELRRVWQEHSQALPFLERQYISRLVTGWDHRARVVEEDMAQSLLRAQISAKALWLRVTEGREAHDVFLVKARRFLAARAAEAGRKGLPVEEGLRGGDGTRRRVCDAECREGWKKGLSRWGKVRG
jgi:hypothetical protein